MTTKNLLFIPLLLLLGASVGEAEPPPLPAEQMWEYSDAIVVVDILRATRTAETNLQHEPVFLVTFCVREVRKGNVKVGRRMVWEMADYQPAPGELGGGVFYPGERYLLYLKESARGEFNTWGHNCVEALWSVPADEQILPTIPGESVFVQNFSPPG